MSEPAHEPLPKYLRLAALAGFGLYFAFYLIHVWGVVRYPYDMDNGEAYLLNQARGMAGGALGYGAIDQEPYIVDNYPPLYPALLSLPVKLGGVSFAWGRWLSVLAALGTGLCLFYYVRNLSGDAIAASIGALSFYSFYYIYEWSVLHRVDSVALFFTMLGLLLASRNNGGWWCIPAFVCALLTRQTMIFAPLAVFACQFAHHERRAAWMTLAGTFGTVIAIYIILNLATGGEFFRHIVSYNANRYEWSGFMNFFRHFFALHAVFGAIGLCYLAWCAANRRVDLVCFYLVLAAASTLLAGKVGAATNYLFEFVLALCLATGLVLAEAWQRAGTEGRFLRILLPSLLIVQFTASWHTPYGKHVWAATPTGKDAASGRSLVMAIDAANGDVLADDSGYLLLAGKSLLFQPFVMSQLSSEGKWNEAPILESIRRKRFGLIVLTFDLEKTSRSERFTPAMLEAIRENYQFREGVYGPMHWTSSPTPWWSYWVYEPKSSS